MKRDSYKELLHIIDSLYTLKSKKEVNLEGIYGETFFIRKEIGIKGIFEKDSNLWLRLSDKDRNPYDTNLERIIDDFTYWTLSKIKEKLEKIIMNQSDKELLLKDLSARIPYGVYCDFEGSSNPVKLAGIKPYDECCYRFGIVWVDPYKNKVLPYLRPMVSMTEEETAEWYSIYPSVETIDFLHSHHFDYRGLVEKGLALKAPDNMYKFE